MLRLLPNEKEIRTKSEMKLFTFCPLFQFYKTYFSNIKQEKYSPFTFRRRSHRAISLVFSWKAQLILAQETLLRKKASPYYW